MTLRMKTSENIVGKQENAIDHNVFYPHQIKFQSIESTFILQMLQ